ncbi:hypothetical protein AALP_AA7G132700 [Arabis alpina]|uniref:BHLH domain-containing protein n=1 Tax=Arabis alpina TaxID=50452 RepID=A0A087GHS0_ARAAL|nr:hypothetical protein AALP_AA7G132700 [Arabis alpina]
MASWFYNRHREDDFFSHLLYFCNVAASQPQISISLAPPPPPTSQVLARGYLITEPGPVLRDSTLVGSSSANEYSLIPVTETPPMVRVSPTVVVPGLGRKEKAVVSETEVETADEDKGNQREETEKTEEGGAGGSRKRSRAAEMHNRAERRRRERINERMKALQELIPRCNKSDKASMLDDAVEYMKSLQLQIQMMSMRCSAMQQFIAMGMNRPPFIPFLGTPPFPSYPPPHYPFPNPVWNQPQFPGYMNPYSQFAGLQQQMQQPPPLQNQTTAQPSFSQASSSSWESEDEN